MLSLYSKYDVLFYLNVLKDKKILIFSSSNVFQDASLLEYLEIIILSFTNILVVLEYLEMIIFPSSNILRIGIFGDDNPLLFKCRPPPLLVSRLKLPRLDLVPNSTLCVPDTQTCCKHKSTTKFLPTISSSYVHPSKHLLKQCLFIHVYRLVLGCSSVNFVPVLSPNS